MAYKTSELTGALLDQAVAKPPVVCHAAGDRCHGCDHYQGKAAECKYKGLPQSGVPANAFCFFRDGDKWCCVFGDFTNLQESPAGFGDTQDEAFTALVGSFVTPNVGIEPPYSVGSNDGLGVLGE